MKEFKGSLLSFFLLPSLLCIYMVVEPPHVCTAKHAEPLEVYVQTRGCVMSHILTRACEKFNN